MTKLIGVDNSGALTGQAKTAVEAVAKPLVDAAEARLAPKPILKTASQEAAKANGAADGPTGIMMRMVVNVKPTVTRWRLRIRNAGATAQGSGTLTSVGVYHAPTAASNKALMSGTAARVITDFSVVGTTEWISPWVTAATAPLGGGKDYSIGFTVKGATSTVMGDAVIPIYTAAETVVANSSSVVPTLTARVPLSVVVEYEAEYAQGAVAQGGIMQVTRDEFLAAKAAGTLDAGVFYAVTEAV